MFYEYFMKNIHQKRRNMNKKECFPINPYSLFLPQTRNFLLNLIFNIQVILYTTMMIKYYKNIETSG